MDKRFSEMTFPEQLSAYESALSEVSRLKAQLQEYSRKMVDAADEIVAWKDATGLECGGDPDGVTPAKAKEFWDVEAKRFEAIKAQAIGHQADIVALRHALDVAEHERDEARKELEKLSPCPLEYTWGNNPKRMTLKGRRCRIIKRGGKGSVLVEFEDGQREIVSWRAVRKTETPE